MRRRHRRGAGRKSKGKKKGGKGIGFVMTVSSPVAAEMRVHMLQWSDSEKGLLHSRLPGKELVIPPPHPTPSRPFICLLLFFPHPLFASTSRRVRDKEAGGASWFSPRGRRR